MNFIIKLISVKQGLVKITVSRADTAVDKINTVIINIYVCANAVIITVTDIVLLIIFFNYPYEFKTHLTRILLLMCFILPFIIGITIGSQTYPGFENVVTDKTIFKPTSNRSLSMNCNAGYRWLQRLPAFQTPFLQRRAGSTLLEILHDSRNRGPLRFEVRVCHKCNSS